MDPRAGEAGAPGLGGAQEVLEIRRGHRFTDDFMMFVFKVEMCKRLDRHDREKCPYAHPGELARRRHPSTYQALPCPEARAKKICPRLENCNCSHSTFEFWLHPDRFKTFMCERGSACDRPVCFFAHTEDELRALPQGLQRTQPMPKQASRAAAVAAAAAMAAASRSEAGSSQAAASSAAIAPREQQQQLGQQQQQRNLFAGPQAQHAAVARTMQQQQQQQPQQHYHAGLHPASFQQQQQAQAQYLAVQLPGGPGMAYSHQQAAPGGFHPSFVPPLGSVMLMRPAPQRGSTVAVIPAGPSAWSGLVLPGVDPGEAPSLEALCAAMGALAMPTEPGKGAPELQLQLQQQVPYKLAPAQLLQGQQQAQLLQGQQRQPMLQLVQQQQPPQQQQAGPGTQLGWRAFHPGL